MTTTTPLSERQPETFYLPHRFTPRSYQQRVFDAFAAGKRRVFLAQHRRSGKDKVLINIMVMAALKRKGVYFYFFPQVNMARRAVWLGVDSDGMSYLDHIPPPLIYHKSQAEMRVILRDPKDPSQPGSVIHFLGTDRHPDVGVGSNPVGVVFSEFALQNPLAWDLIRPILRERSNNGWAAFITTPRGKNHAYTLYNLAVANPSEWHVESLDVTQTFRDAPGEDGTPVVTLDDIEKDRLEGMTQDMIDQEYYISWEAAIPGAYFAEEFRSVDRDERITFVGHDPRFQVSTAWDLGWNDETAIWFFQKVGNQIRLIDYEEDRTKSLQHYIQIVKDKPYIYETHYGPHDIKVHEYGNHGQTRWATASKLGVEFEPVPNIPHRDGINAVRNIFPRCIWDAVKCERGIEALRSYRRKYDEVNKTHSDKPVHDWASNGADAFRYLAVGIQDLSYHHAVPMYQQHQVAHGVGMSPFEMQRARRRV